MDVFPLHALSQSYGWKRPTWRVIDSGVISQQLGNGVLRVRDSLGQAIYAVDVEFEVLTQDDADLLQEFYVNHRASSFYWVDWETCLTYECHFHPGNPSRPYPHADVPDTWNCQYTLLPVLPTVSVDMLLAHWTMDGAGVLLVGDEEALEVGTDEVLLFGGGMEVVDVSGNGHTGTASAATDTMATDGKLDNALAFDGADDYVEVADAVALRLTDGGDLMAWINPDTLGENDAGRIVDKSNTTEAGAGYCFALGDGNKLAFRVAGDTEWTLSIANAITTGLWQHVAVSFDASGRRLYVNGRDVTASGGTLTNTPPTATPVLRIGNRAGATDYSFDGAIDDVRIYGRPLTDLEHQAIYNNGSGTQEAIVV